MRLYELGDHAQIQENVDDFAIVTSGSSVCLTNRQFWHLIACYARELMGRSEKSNE